MLLFFGELLSINFSFLPDRKNTKMFKDPHTYFCPQSKLIVDDSRWHIGASYKQNNLRQTKSFLIDHLRVILTIHALS